MKSKLETVHRGFGMTTDGGLGAVSSSRSMAIGNGFFAVFHLAVWAFLGFRLIPLVNRIFVEMLDGASLPWMTEWVLRIGAAGCLAWGILGSGLAVVLGRFTGSAVLRGGVLGFLLLVLMGTALALVVPLMRF